MKRKLPPLNSLKAFEAASRLKSFTAAGQELLVSAGAISHQIARLEQDLGLSLFWRRNNEIGLTQVGAEYYDGIKSAIDRIESTSLRVMRASGSNTLRVRTSPTFATKWLLPRLSKFIDLNPKIDLQLTTSLTRSRPDEFNLHLLVQSDKPPFPSNCDVLFDSEFQAVCSPRLLANIGTLSAPKDVLKFRLLHSAFAATAWRDWLRLAGVSESKAEAGLVFENAALVYQAAVAGLGIACAETHFIKSDIAAGNLISPFDIRLDTGHKYVMLTNPVSANLDIVQLFRGWLLAEAAVRIA